MTICMCMELFASISGIKARSDSHLITLSESFHWAFPNSSIDRIKKATIKQIKTFLLYVVSSLIATLYLQGSALKKAFRFPKGRGHNAEIQDSAVITFAASVIVSQTLYNFIDFFSRTQYVPARLLWSLPVEESKRTTKISLYSFWIINRFKIYISGKNNISFTTSSMSLSWDKLYNLHCYQRRPSCTSFYLEKRVQRQPFLSFP